MRFDVMADLGYGRSLVPIIPHDAEISSYAKDPKLADNRGKVPGRQVSDGWVGFHGWQDVQAMPADTLLWEGWGAGVGLATRHFPAFDIDLLDEFAADAAEEILVGILGPAPLRVGRWPKRLLVYRGPAGQGKRRLVIAADAQVEFLADGQQFVVDGIHPKTGKPYTWPRPLVPADDLNEATPDKVEAALVALQAFFGGKVTGMQELTTPVAQDGLEAPSIEAVRQALEAVPNEADYDTWIKIGVAIKAATGGSEEGAQLWLDWSAQWDGDDTGADAKWDTFRPPYRVGWDFLSSYAAKHGTFMPADFDFDEVPFEEPPVSAAKKEKKPATAGKEPSLFPEDDELFERFVWVEAFGQAFDLRTRKLLPALQFSVLNNHLGDPTSSKTSAWAKWLRSDRLQRAQSVTYRPGCEQFVTERGVLCLNTWQPSSLMAIEGDATPWLDHLAYIYPNAEEREVLLDWFAFLLQHPAEKPAFQVLMGSTEEGVGKDLALLPIIAALGENNVRIATATQVTSPRTDWYEGRRLIVVEEMEHFGKRETANMLKPYLAAPPHMVPISKVYCPIYEVPNIGAMLFFTNHEDALPLPRGDRRVFVMWSEAIPRSEAYYTGFVKWYEEGGEAFVVDMLMKRDLRKHLLRRRAPLTAAKEAMQMTALTPLEEWLYTGVRDAHGVFSADLIGIDELLFFAKAHARWDQGTAPRLARHLKRAGARALERVRFAEIQPNGRDRDRIYSLRRHEMYAGLTTDKLREIYLKQRTERSEFSAVG